MKNSKTARAQLILARDEVTTSVCSRVINVTINKTLLNSLDSGGLDDLGLLVRARRSRRGLRV